MRILAIETSCDDTGIAILEIGGRLTSPDFKVLSNIVSSQQIHQNYGGVFPMMAKREHQRNLLPVLKQALKESKLLKISNSKFLISNKILNSKFKTTKSILEREGELLKKLLDFFQKYEKPDVDFIAVTNGPGLEPCLWVGVNFARALSYFWNIPIIPVNHIEGHILVNYLENPKINFPALALVVSGGHTQLILMKDIGKYKIIGETRDDAAGECFDKCAKLLGLGYPGGPQIAAMAAISQKNAETNAERRGNEKFRVVPRKIPRNSTISLPRPMINTKDYDFSFSGLKTAVLYATRDNAAKLKDKDFIGQMCFEVQQAIIDVLLKKTIQAARDFSAKGGKIKTIILGGGVSANKELRKQFTGRIAKEVYHKTHGRDKVGIRVIFPDPKLSTDNALMIAVTAFFHRTKKIGWRSLSVHPNLRVGNDHL